MLLQVISDIYEQSENSDLNEFLFERINENLTYVAKSFKVNKMQAFFIAQIFTLDYIGEYVNIKTISQHLGCSPTKLLGFSKEIDELIEKGILKKGQFKLKGLETYSKNYLELDKKICDAILYNTPVPDFCKENFEDIYQLFEKINYYIGQREEGSIDTRILFRRVSNLLYANKQFAFIEKIIDFGLKDEDQCFYLSLIWNTLIGKKTSDVTEMLNDIFDSSAKKAKYMQSLINKENELLKRRFIELEESEFFNDLEVKLAEISLQLLKEEGITFYLHQKKRNILLPAELPQKTLFFAENNLTHIQMLQNILTENSYQSIKQRLQSKGFSAGINILLYGPPGTGKTESVYQMAKQTNRNIFAVDISQTKSSWYGESEKLIKNIFIEYKDYKEQCEYCPILLFNEADAIITQRLNLKYSLVSKTENAMQNILLEEMEKFEGILIATTNIVDNFDSAFERRFLFKIKFQKPAMQEKILIWKSKLIGLNEEEYTTLAHNYDFSGGEIENVVRKIEMYEIIHGKVATLDKIIDFCNTEKLETKSVNSMGFKTKNYH